VSQDLEAFRNLFWPTFKTPKLGTERFCEIMRDLETTSDWLAGPLHHIYEEGDCDYVFQDDSRFPGVHDSESFLAWCLEVVEEYRGHIQKHHPLGEGERADRNKLLEVANRMEELSRLAAQVIAKRDMPREGSH
jgi:hypothetical protein